MAFAYRRQESFAEEAPELRGYILILERQQWGRPDVDQATYDWNGRDATLPCSVS